MKTTIEEIEGHRQAVAAIRGFRHPDSGWGVAQELMLKLMALDRALLAHARDFVARDQELVREYGTETVPGDPDSMRVRKDSPVWGRFLRLHTELLRSEVDVPDALCIRLDELKVRGKGGEMEPLDLGEIALLGRLLIIDTSEKPKPAKGGKR